MEKKEVLIQTTNVFKTVKKKLILKNINLKLFSNKFHAFIGENGSGKSTLMNIITGDDLNYEGEVNIFLDNDKPNRSFLYFKTDLKFPQHL
uniref:ATP-binding cassette domain-containing protein n=1 Tax=Mycoplasmopsis lipofaciens TaxID=114884 RepID=UPI0004836EC3